MNPLNYIHKISAALLETLPGPEAHYKMAPYKKGVRESFDRNGKTPRLSAVMVLLYPKNQALHMVLMRRPEYEGTHSGQISFPGGKKEDADPDLQTTALRETYEEVGIQPENVQVIGRLTDVYIPPSGFLVSPFVGFLKDTPTFTPDPREVAAVIETPIDHFLDPTIVKQKKLFLKSHQVYIDVPYYDVQSEVVWGATSAMLSEFKEILLRIEAR